MSELIKKKSNEHQVKHLFSGKEHFFEIVSVSGKKYSVIIKIGCDCPFMGIQGIANGEICSHILAVFKKIVQEGKIRIGAKEND